MMLSVIGKMLPSSAQDIAVLSIDIGKNQTVHIAGGRSQGAENIAPTSAGRNIGPLGSLIAGRGGKGRSRSERGRFLKNLAGSALPAGLMILGFSKLTTSTLQKRCVRRIINTPPRDASSSGRKRLEAGISKFCARTATGSKRTSNLGPNLFVTPPSPAKQETMEF